MKQAIAGVAPSALAEVTVMTVWPSLAATRYGRWWGRRYANNLGLRLPGVGFPLTAGRVLALLSIPFILPVYFYMLIPRLPLVVYGWVNSACRRYRITNRRVIIESALGGPEQQGIALDGFDDVQVEILPGQAWYHAGDLVFRSGQVEAMRLAGVPRPDPFQRACLAARQSYLGVQEARTAGLAI